MTIGATMTDVCQRPLCKKISTAQSEVCLPTGKTPQPAVDYLRYRLIQAVRGTAAVGHVNVLAPPATPAHQVWYRELVRPGDEVLANAGGESAHW